MAIEWFSHFPFRTRIEKCEFIPGLYFFKADQYHLSGIKEGIGGAAVVNVLQKFRHQRDMLVKVYLHSITICFG